VKIRDLEAIDPHLLVGLVNTALRNGSESPEDFAKTHALDPARLVERLEQAGYDYRPDQRQFR